MLVPLILIPLLTAAGGVGVAVGLSGVSNMVDAEEIARVARERHEDALLDLDNTRLLFNEIAEGYGQQQLHAAHTVVRRFLTLLEQQRHAHRRQATLFEGLHIQPVRIQQGQQLVAQASHLLYGGMSAVGAGSMTSGAAVGVVGLLGTAGTGTAISSLSGAAAQSAILAWLGGGSLAIGGGGMALGSLVLGGITIAPALLVGGFAIASQGERALSEARRFEAQVDRQIAEMNCVQELLSQTLHRIEELSEVLDQMVSFAEHFLSLPPSPHNLSSAAIFVNGIIGILSTPVLLPDGNLNTSTIQVIAQNRQILFGFAS